MSLKNLLLDCLFPKKCYGCNAPKTWLCTSCFLSLKHYLGEKPRALNDSSDLIIAGEYKDSLLHDLITAFKFKFNRELVVPLSAFLKIAIDEKIMLNNFNKDPWQNILVIPVPLHKTREKIRGFNQSELIAYEISRIYDWPLNLDLKKIKKTAIQAELKEKYRLINQAKAFKWCGENLAGHDIILIDDIITSGATISEATLVLKEAGARRIIKVAVAKG